MKKNLKLTMISAILLSLTFAFISCEAEERKWEGNVPFKSCDSSNRKSFSGLNTLRLEDVYLFKDSVPEQILRQIDNEILSTPFSRVYRIVYCSETDGATIWIGSYHSSGGIEIVQGLICNFPDFAKKWDIPRSGIKVDIETLMYVEYKPPGNLAVVLRIYYCILTNLERR